MRKDFQNILVERERIGSSKRSRKTALHLKAEADIEAHPGFPGWGRRGHGYYQGKELNENLKPFERFLEKSVGRNWNKVYSEIREQIDPRRAIGLHVLQHLGQMVSLHPEQRFYGDLYVDSKTGI